MTESSERLHTKVTKLDQILISNILLDWWQTNRRQFPWRKRLPLWKGLLAELMLQRTRASQVRKSFNYVDKHFPTAESLNGITKVQVDSIFAPLGLKWRVPVFIELTREIVRRKGRLPKTEAKLQNLPGVGAYAASAALSLHGNMRAIIVDSNTVRIVSRLFGIEFGPETRRKGWVKDALEALTPACGFREFNYALLDLGALVCTPRNPNCSVCPLAPECKTGQAATNDSYASS